jgi:hypothetical protein
LIQNNKSMFVKLRFLVKIQKLFLGFICHSLSDKEFSFAKNSTTKIRKLFKMQAIYLHKNKIYIISAD